MPTTSVRIPKAGQAMTEGTIAEWLVVDGATVRAGDVIYRLETEKIEMDVEAPVAGTLTIVEAVGTTHDVGTEIARIES